MPLSASVNVRDWAAVNLEVLRRGARAPKIGDVTIYGDRVEVADSDEYFAKKKLVDAFDDVRKAVRRRLASQPEGKL